MGTGRRQGPDQVQVTGTALQTRLRVGDPDCTVSGRHRYRIAYRLGGVAQPSSGGSGGGGFGGGGGGGSW